MPATISLFQIGVWFCVGFFTACGWGLGLWLVASVTAKFPG